VPKDEARLEALRAELARARTLIPQLAALVDHYAQAYRESQQRLAQAQRELADLRRPGKIRRLE